MPGCAELEILVHRLWHHTQVQLLGAFGFAKRVKSHAVARAVFQPVLQRQTIALRLRNLLALFVEEHFVDQRLGRPSAKYARNLAALHAAVGQILAVHFIIDAQSDPAHRPIDLPLQLGFAAQDRLRYDVAIVVETDQTGLGIDDLDRHLQHDAGLLANRQDGRIGRGAFLAQRRQHDVHNALIVAQHVLQRLIKPTRFVER